MRSASLSKQLATRPQRQALPLDERLVESLARPGGNTTGFSLFEYGISGKWLELLKEIAPSVTRAAIIRDSTIASGAAQLAAIQAVAPSFRVELRPVAAREVGEIERAVAAFAREPNGGLIVTIGPLQIVHRDLNPNGSSPGSAGEAAKV
jgi:putative tryptophan/tyrosine transport system substrate-binding protein